MASATDLRWDVVEERLDEAGVLWGQWARGLDDPEYDLALPPAPVQLMAASDVSRRGSGWSAVQGERSGA